MKSTFGDGKSTGLVVTRTGFERYIHRLVDYLAGESQQYSCPGLLLINTV